MLEQLLEMKHGKPTLKPNYKFIPCTQVTTKKINKIHKWLKEQKWNKIKRTPSGGISIKKLVLPAWDIRSTNFVVEITLITGEGQWRIQKRKDKSKGMSGAQAFKKFKDYCKLFGINLDNYAKENGIETKKGIEKYIISLEDSHIKNLVLSNVHHIDYHSSFPLGLINNFPEFKPVIQFLYDRRKTDEECKQILNYAIGFMQSIGGCQAKWAHISKAAIADNNKRIRELAKELKDNNRTILAYNTDGIWYCGDVYHNENEGPDLGQWANDHTNCTIRFKSAGSYEYIENGKYTPVVRGETLLEDPEYEYYKPREKWEWGDIYGAGAKIKMFYFTEEDGIVEVIKDLNEEGEEIW